MYKKITAVSLTVTLIMIMACSCRSQQETTLTMYTTPVLVKIAGYQLSDIVAGPDGNLWFTEPFVNQIGKISSATGVITEYQVSNTGVPLSFPNGITYGPDGNLWFVESSQQSSYIYRISPVSDEIIKYPVNN